MNIEYNIRPFEIADLDELIRLREESLAVNPEAFGSSLEEGIDPEKYREVLSGERPGEFILGAFDGDKAIGMVGYRRSNRLKQLHKGYIWGMYVSPDDRGYGIGRRLMEECLERAKANPGLEQIQLSVITSQIEARSLYEDVGFETVGFERACMKIGDQYYDDELMIYFIYQPPVNMIPGGDAVGKGGYAAMAGLLALLGFIVYLFIFWLKH